MLAGLDGLEECCLERSQGFVLPVLEVSERSPETEYLWPAPWPHEDSKRIVFTAATVKPE